MKKQAKVALTLTATALSGALAYTLFINLKKKKKLGGKDDKITK